MFYEIEDNIFNLDEVLYVSWNQVATITIGFNNKSKLIIEFGLGCYIGGGLEEAKESYNALCNEFYNKNKGVNNNE